VGHFGGALAAACIEMQTIEQSACVGWKETWHALFNFSLDGLYGSLNMEEEVL